MKGTPMAHEHCITIVDDPSVREAATNLFRSMGFVAVAFASAKDFLSSDALEKTSCLVLDVQMPGMGGLNLQSYLAATGRHLPIVFVTGYPDVGVRDRAMQAGAVCFLTKPFNEDDLIDGLKSALTNHRQQ
jgi:FixJ family two-component response regulator